MVGSSSLLVFYKGEEVTLHWLATWLWEYVWKPEHVPPQLEQFVASLTQGLLL